MEPLEEKTIQDSEHRPELESDHSSQTPLGRDSSASEPSSIARDTEAEASESSNDSVSDENDEATPTETPVTEELIPRADYDAALQQAQVLTEQLFSLKSIRKAERLLHQVQDWAIDPDGVLAMVGHRFALDDGDQLIPVDTQGNALQADGKPVGVDAFFKQLREQKPYLVKASGIPGAGSTSQPNHDAQPLSMDNLAELPMAQYIKAGGLLGKLI
jgi:hypothetical protein